MRKKLGTLDIAEEVAYTYDCAAFAKRDLKARTKNITNYKITLDNFKLYIHLPCVA